MNLGSLSILVLAGLALSGCANLDSIGRVTNIYRGANGGQTAIHLDVKQRVVVSKDADPQARFMAICAEPSPDALSAYTQSLGLAASVAGEGAGSLSHGASESAASIGLRTQAITLMRDSLYRVCEAYYNRALNSAQVPQLLNHAQDVTVAILAIEQLTGAVAAQQTTLGGTGTSGASAQVASIQSLLDSARAAEKARADELAATLEAQAAAQKERDAAEAALSSEQDGEKKVPLQTELGRKEAALEAAKRSVAAAELRHKDAQAAADAIEKTPTSALASSDSDVSGTAQLGSLRTVPPIDAEATKYVASAVKNIVDAVVKKDYVRESCMAYLTRNWEAEGIQDYHVTQTLDMCRDIITKSAHVP